MAYLFTSDLHLGHTNIIKYCDRPFKTVNHMNESLIKKWNDVVKSGDTVFHLGDFCHKTARYNCDKFIARLNGHIIFIKGNHDNSSLSIIETATIEYGGKVWGLCHNPEDATEKFNLTGHVHERWRTKKIGDKVCFNVGCDVNNFQPISIKTIIKELEK